MIVMPSPGRVLQAVFLATSAGCVIVHALLLVRAQSAPAAAMLALAAACGLCLRPGRAAPSPRAWGSVLAMALSMSLLHLWFGGAGLHGAGGHAHSSDIPAAGGVWHPLALALGGAELVIAMIAVLGIGIRRRLAMRTCDPPSAAPASHAA